jgi:hypothetical protein
MAKNTRRKTPKKKKKKKRKEILFKISQGARILHVKESKSQEY